MEAQRLPSEQLQLSCRLQEAAALNDIAFERGAGGEVA